MDYIEHIKHANEGSPYAASQGIEVKDISLGKSLVELVVSPGVLNHWGSVHGGALFTLADMAAGTAAASYGGKVVTVDSSFSFMKAVTKGTVVAKGEVIRHGKHLTFVRVSMENGDGEPVCQGSFTFACIG